LSEWYSKILGENNLLEMLRTKVGKLIIGGHRGADGYAPENTMASFKKALETGADVIEFDVHLSKDDRCVIMHDELLDRTTNGRGYIREYTWAELSKLEAGSWFDRKSETALAALEAGKLISSNPDYQPLPIPTEKFVGEPIPLLEEVLQWAKSVGIMVSIELKSPWPFYYGMDSYPGMVEKVLDLVACYGDEEATSIHSFDHRMMLHCKELNPNIATMVSYGGAIFVDPLGPVRAAKANGYAIGSYWVSPELIEASHAEDIFVFGWGLGADPLNEAKDLHRLVAMGVDFVSGGYPDLLRKVVENS
jgi:glycerophosphoryl diester phosphodiesterase